MKTFVAMTLLALGATYATGASARLTDNSALSFGSQVDFAKVLGGVFGAATTRKPNEGKATVLIEYAVPPPVQSKFVEIFKALQEQTEKEPGVKIFGLSRTVDENLSFYLYSEWDDMKAYGEHYESDYVKDYLEAISKIGVVYKLHILDQITFIKPGLA